jgi:hypothetical protein
MRYGPLFLAALVLVACSGDRTFLTATGRPPPPAVAAPSAQIDSTSDRATGWLWLMVVDPFEVCVDGAVVEIASGPGKGLKGTPLASCDAWDWEGGFLIYGLVPGDSITIRASASGYQDAEKTFVPSTAERPQVSTITLSKLDGQPPSIPLGEQTLGSSH